MTVSEPGGLALLTDQYELTMAAAYFASGHNPRATFDLYVRHLPDHRNFLVAAGLEQALEYLESVRFSEDDLDYLRGQGIFDEDFLTELAALSFTGDVWAIPEGELVFPHEPLMRVTAPLMEAQIVETYLINCVGHPTLVASKAARVMLACGDKPFVDFSARRDHGPDAAMAAARASFIGGAVATSNVLAGKRYGIPISGTMAHSFVMAFGDEREAFRTFARTFPSNAVLLIDTYDTIEGARIAVEVADGLAPEGISIRAVRIDSGDLGPLTKEVRRIFDGAGHPEIEIFLSGDLDEYRIEEILDQDAPADGFGVGTQMGTSADSPAIGMVYKLVADEVGAKTKRSPGKGTLGGIKQVYRFERDGVYDHDLIALADDPAPPGARPILEQVMEGGKRLDGAPDLDETQVRCRDALSALPEALRDLHRDADYPVEVAPSVKGSAHVPK